MNRYWRKIKKIARRLGPGFITGASDDDPSGIATYSQTGGQFGYRLLWTSFFSIPFMIVIQEMCGRIGMVTGKGLSGVIRKHYSKGVLYAAVTLLLFANIVNIGADLGAMASSAKLVLGAPFIILLIGIAVSIVTLEIILPYKKYARVLKYLTLSLLAYIVTAFVVRQDWTAVLRYTLVPHFEASKEYMLNIVAFLGTTISPYLFFWQADEEVEEEIEHRKILIKKEISPRITEKDVRAMGWDTAAGMIFSNFITFFIILTTAATLGRFGITDVSTADQAAQALKPLAGNFAFLLFTLGVIGTGLLAVPVLAGSASYALSEAMGWRSGLYLKFNRAKAFYIIIILATLIGLLINFSPIPPFKMLYYAAALNGVIAPPLMILILLIANNKSIMGEHVNSLGRNILGWSITFIMTAASVLLFLSFR